MNYVNGVPLTKNNIAFMKSVQEQDRLRKQNELKSKVAKVKNFSKDAPATPIAFAAPKTKKSHAQRKAEIVARSIANDPKNKVGKGRSVK